jgi:dephospho-CoA kinase
LASGQSICGLLLARLQSFGDVTPEQDELLRTSLRNRHQMQAEPKRHLQRLIQKLLKSRGIEEKRRHRLQANPSGIAVSRGRPEWHM